ncbi:MAG: CBS domain-containing protein [Thermoproteota archaeon]
MSIESVTISSVMVRNVKTAKEGQTVKAVAKMMADNNIGSVVIVKSNDSTNPVGIITERDIVRIVGQQVSTLQVPARDVMSKPIITIDEASSLKDAIQEMELYNIRRLPVVDKEKKMVGIVTDKDIFKAIMKSQTLVASFCESLTVEYKPVYEKLSEFMLGEMPMPGGKP